MLVMVLMSLGAAGVAHAQAAADKNNPQPTLPTPAGLPTVRAGAEERVAAVKQDRRTASGDATLGVELTVDRVEMTVAERVYATLAVSTRAEAVVMLPEDGKAGGFGGLKEPQRSSGVPGSATPTTLGGFNVVSRDVSERDEGAMRRTTVRYVLEPFLAGEKTIPALEVRAKDGGRSLSLKTEPVKVLVKAVAGEKDDASTPLEPLRATMEIAAPVKRKITRGMIIAGGAALVGMLAAFGFMIAHSRLRARPVDPVVRVHEGLSRVRTMLAADSSRAGATAAATELRRVFAEYLRDGVGLPADTQTGSELAAAAEQSSVSAEAKAELVRLLGDMDRVRFAPDAAVGPVVEHLVTQCGTLVDGINAAGVRP
jgi:hypothetical protein